MATEHRRGDRVAAAIREVVATFLAEEAKDPRITSFVTVTGVEVIGERREFSARTRRPSVAAASCARDQLQTR